MPQINKIYKIRSISKKELIEILKTSLKKMGGKSIEKSGDVNSIKLKSVVPSIWGWGGMYLTVVISTTNPYISEINLIGEIAQLGVTPLTKKMDEFMKIFADILGDKYGYELQYEKTTKFLGMPKMSFPSDSYLLYLLFFTVLLFVIIMFMSFYP